MKPDLIKAKVREALRFVNLEGLENRGLPECPAVSSNALLLHRLLLTSPKCFFGRAVVSP